jgi:uncharacterized protein YjbI with pentapeptide repeats
MVRLTRDDVMRRIRTKPDPSQGRNPYEGQLDLSGVDLSGIDLSHLDLSFVKLAKANLNRANLYGATLYQTNFYCANLCNARLDQANANGVGLVDADLSNASLIAISLVHAEISRAKLWNANLTNAVFGATELSGTEFSGAILRGAQFRVQSSGYPPNFAKADLRGADFSQSGERWLSTLDFRDATYDHTTRWTAGFDPERSQEETERKSAEEIAKQQRRGEEEAGMFWLWLKQQKRD